MEVPWGHALALRFCARQCVVWMPGDGRIGGKRWTLNPNAAKNLVFLRTIISTNKMQSAVNFSDVYLCSMTVHMPVPLIESVLPPRCEICGIGTVRIGKLPRVGLRPLVYVYKCDACNQITSVEPERQEDTSRRRLISIRRPRR